jgi:flagella basal body P-ring formation protein FlgA
MKRILFPLAAALSAPALAAPFQDLALLDAEVMRFTGVPVGSPGGASLPVDRRLKLAVCRQGLALGWNGARRDAVVVQCTDPDGWRIFVPVSGASAPAGSGPAPVAVARGEAVTIMAEGAGFSVSQGGQALDAGPVGGWIRVQPDGRKEPLRARIVRPGLVAVPVR